ncbi:thioredoxin family protein [Marinoscillum sp. 108]|uniref:thioredoxin family protein n=1 Tax=Marinoscillum sp. 108 TaxID=2653151 RepID=UPI0013572BD7|nr:thioredoxin family protein [Marinoscillum sp. 108]
MLVRILWMSLAFGLMTSYNSPPEGNKYQLIIFEGSDWCVNCRRLERSVLSDVDFQVFLEANNISLIRVDFPQRNKLTAAQKNQNDSIARRYDFRGVYPTIVLVEPTDQAYLELGYMNETSSDFARRIDLGLKQLK